MVTAQKPARLQREPASDPASDPASEQLVLQLREHEPPVCQQRAQLARHRVAHAAPGSRGARLRPALHNHHALTAQHN